MRRKLKKCEEGGNPQGQNPQEDIVVQISQMLQQGGNPMEVVMNLMQQQMAPEQIVQILVQAGLPQEQAMQSVQQVMQQSQGQQQGQQEQPMMEFGGEFKKEFSKSLSDKLALPSSTTEDYTNERFKVFTEAVRKNFAKSVLDNSNSFQPLTEAEMGMDLMKAAAGLDLATALSKLGVTKEEFLANDEKRIMVENYINSYEKGNEKPVTNDGGWSSIGKSEKEIKDYTKNNPSFQTRNGIIYDAQGNAIGMGFAPPNQNQGNAQYYNQGTQQIPFYGYQDPRFQTPQMSPFLRLLEQNANRNYRLKNIQYNGVPTDLDMTGVLAGTNPNYSIDKYEIFNNRKGLFRKEKGIRFYLNPKDGSFTPVNNQNNISGPGYQGYNADANGDGVPDYLSQGINSDNLSAINPNMQPNWQDKTGQGIPKDLKNQFMGNVVQTTDTPATTSMSTSTSAGNNYTDEDITKAVTNSNRPFNKDEQAMLNVLLKNKGIANDYTPEQLRTIVDGMGAEALGRYRYNTQTGEREIIEQFSPDEMERLQRKKLQDIDDLAENVRKKQYQANPNMFQEGVSTDPYVRPTNEFIDSPSVDEILKTQGNGNQYRALQEFNKQEAWKNQGVKSNFLGKPRLADGTFVEYNEAEQKHTPIVEFSQRMPDGTVVNFMKQGRNKFVPINPIKAFGGDVNRYNRNMFKAVDGMDMGNGEFVDYSFDKQRTFNPSDVADFSKNAADQLSYFAEMARNFATSRDRENAFYSSANMVPNSMNEMSRGLYTDQGDFNPVDLGNQVLNPTNYFGDNSMNYMMANGGDVSFTPEELEVLKKAGYNLK